jgi:flagellar protein FlaG
VNISSVDMGGAMTGASVTVAAPAKTTGSSQPAQTAGGDASAVQVKQMVADMQGQLDSMNISLQYTLYGEHDKKIAVKVVNKDTGNVIREIPPKEMQALQSKMGELVGMIFNEKG